MQDLLVSCSFDVSICRICRHHWIDGGKL